MVSSLEATLLIIWVVPVLAIFVFSIRAFARPTIQPTIANRSFSSRQSVRIQGDILVLDRNPEYAFTYCAVTGTTETIIQNQVATLFLN